MNCILTRKLFLSLGIFGELHDENGNLIAVTCEHSFDGLPKLAVGTYTCDRGLHKLESSPAPFTTFEVKDVPEFQGKPVSGILFHVGNWGSDSFGCILLGESYGEKMLLNSKIAFNTFMQLQAGVDSFNLIVK